MKNILLIYLTIISFVLSCKSEEVSNIPCLSPSSVAVYQKPPILKLKHQGTSENPIKLVLIMPRSKNQKEKPTRYPVGLMSLASCLRDKSFLFTLSEKLPNIEYKSPSKMPNIQVKIVDLQAEKENFDLETYLLNFNPDIVGVTSVTPLFDHALDIAELTKRVVPDAIRLIGGVHMSALSENPDELKKTLMMSEFDCSIIKEGEEVLSEMILNILNNQSISEIPGLIFKNEIDIKSKIEKSYRRSYLRLEDYSFPSSSLDLINVNGYLQSDIYQSNNPEGMIGALFTTRGCFGKCIFCASGATLNRPGRIRMRSAENVFAEISDYVAKGINTFYILDDNFCINTNRLVKLAKLMKENNIKISLKAMARADSITPEVLQALKDIGCYCLALGFETGDQNLLNTLNKDLDLRVLENATKLIKQYEIDVQYFVMVGLPNQNWISIKKTADFLIKNRPNNANVSIAIPYPGSQLYKDGNIVIDSEKENYEAFRHEPDPGKKHEIFLSTTYTKVMTKEEITSSRDILMDLIKCIREKNELEITKLMNLIDKLIRESHLESTKTFLYKSIFRAA